MEFESTLRGRKLWSKKQGYEVQAYEVHGHGSAKKMSAKPGRAAKERQRPSTPGMYASRERQYVRAAVQSTEASALTGTQTRSRKRRATEPGVQSAAARVAATSQQSSATMSSTPRGTRRTRHSAVEQVHTRTDLDQDPAADTSTNLSIPNEQDHTEVEVATTTAAPTPHFEKYTMGLIKDIETSIRRCQERIIPMPPLSDCLPFTARSKCSLKTSQRAEA